MNMTRRGFLKTMGGIIVAPYVITTPGVLMPVRAIIQPMETLTIYGETTTVIEASNLDIIDLISYYTLSGSNALDPRVDKKGELTAYLRARGINFHRG